MPECFLKSVLSMAICISYGAWCEKKKIWMSGAAGGVKGRNENLLIPDLADWKMRQIPRRFNAADLWHTQPWVESSIDRVKEAIYNLYVSFSFVKGFMQPFQLQYWVDNPLPNWVLEVEWLREAFHERKGHRKIIDGFFDPTYTGPEPNLTTVDEAWLLVISKTIRVPPNPKLPFYLVVLRWLGIRLPYFIQILCILDTLLTSTNWSGLLRPKDARPGDHSPFLAIYFRGAVHQPRYYFHLEWNTNFQAPPNSIYAKAPRLDVNEIMSRLYGEVEDNGDDQEEE